MESKEKKTPVLKEDGTIVKNDQVWTEEGLKRFKEYQNDYIKKSYRTFVYRVRRDCEADLIAFCEKQDNFSAMITSLVKKQMMAEGLMPSQAFHLEGDKRIRVELEYSFKEEYNELSTFLLANHRPVIMGALEEDTICYETRINNIDIYGPHFFSVDVDYSPEYSIPGVASMVGENINAYINKKYPKILTQFGLKPGTKVLDSKYEIKNIELAP